MVNAACFLGVNWLGHTWRSPVSTPVTICVLWYDIVQLYRLAKQKTVSAHLWNEQILPFGFTRQYTTQCVYIQIIPTSQYSSILTVLQTDSQGLHALRGLYISNTNGQFVLSFISTYNLKWWVLYWFTSTSYCATNLCPVGMWIYYKYKQKKTACIIIKIVHTQSIYFNL